MRLAVISPKNYFELTEKYSDDCILVLAHWLIEDEEYKEKVRDLKVGCKILDNSAAEGRLVDNINVLLELADDIDADEVVIPDAYKNSQASIAYVERFYDEVVSDYKPFVVIQGSSFKEFVMYWNYIHEMGYTDSTIGIPNEVFMVLGGKQPRNKYLYYMMGNYPWVMDYDIHYLGYTTQEDWWNAPRIVRSTDSGIFLKAALKNMYDLPERHIKGFHLDVDLPYQKDVYDRAVKIILKTKERMRRGW